jgi:hypothetical protein
MRVEEALRNLFKKEITVSLEAVKDYVVSSVESFPYKECRVDQVNIGQYDVLLSNEGGCC